MKILILNWRDIKNPASGGAEVLTHEMAKRWVKWGHEVTQFSSFFNGAEKEELVDGVRIIRKGNPDARYLLASVHFMAFWFYRKHFRNKFDVVIDEIHGIPFFTPLYIKTRKIALICEIAGDIWDTVFKFPANKIGTLVENSYFNFYKNIDFLTISLSTKNDLIKKGISKNNITVLPMGITVPLNLKNFIKEKNPTLIFVGRLIETKGVEDAIIICNNLRKRFSDIKLWIIGRGESSYKKNIDKLIIKMGIQDKVIFFGFVSENKKFELMQRAHVLLAPSIKEGFGLTVPEAGYVGTPAVAYDVEGLRDIIINGKNGFLVKRTVKNMEEKVEALLSQTVLYEKIQADAIRYSKSLSWDNTARVAMRCLENYSDQMIN